LKVFVEGYCSCLIIYSKTNRFASFLGSYRLWKILVKIIFEILIGISDGKELASSENKIIATRSNMYAHDSGVFLALFPPNEVNQTDLQSEIQTFQ
jgi:hypothetical protein